MLAAVGRLGRSVRPPAPAPSLPLLLPPARGRKSRHDPPAKSKIGRLRTPTPVDPVEMYIVTERYKSYRQIVRALRYGGGAARAPALGAGPRVSPRGAGPAAGRRRGLGFPVQPGEVPQTFPFYWEDILPSPGDTKIGAFNNSDSEL
uniref:Small ribosomal subunit protein mS26 n=1 Tax=Sarcophilus harrisii TaxID=9305 RepID=A0A7N4PZL1_SARHA